MKPNLKTPTPRIGMKTLKLVFLLFAVVGVCAFPSFMSPSNGITLKLKRTPRSLDQEKRYASNSLTLDDLYNYSNLFLVRLISVYTATIQIGSQQTNFQVLIDSLSADFWIPSVNCTTGGCVNRNTLGGGKTGSTTLVQTNTPWSIDYGSNGTVSGVLVYDTVSVAGLTIKAMKFGMAEVLDPRFNENVCSCGRIWLNFRTLTVSWDLVLLLATCKELFPFLLIIW
jgi:hypothetical protein